MRIVISSSAGDTVSATFQRSAQPCLFPERPLKKILLEAIAPLVILLSTFSLSGTVLAQGPGKTQGGFHFSIGAGVVSSPYFLGDDNYQNSIFPNLSISVGDRFSASFRGIQYKIISSDAWQAGPVLSYDSGREENPNDSPLSISGNSSTDLIGLGDIDGTFRLGGFVEYTSGAMTTKLELHKGIDGGHEGLTAQAGVTLRSRHSVMGRTALLAIGPVMSFADDVYNSTFFDISVNQSAASGISRFSASSGMNSFGLHTSAILPLTKKTSLVALVNYDRLTGDVKRSSIVSERGSEDQITAGIFVNYRF